VVAPLNGVCETRDDMKRPSIFEFAGGAEAFRALAAATHERCLADPELNHPFSHGIDPNHVENLGAYWAEVFGGPPQYTRDRGGHSAMMALHAGQGAPEDMGRRFAACFVAAIDDAGLPDDPDLRRALKAYIAWAVGEVMEYSPQGREAPPGMPMPRWSWEGRVEG
jgi:hemoglobin